MVSARAFWLPLIGILLAGSVSREGLAEDLGVCASPDAPLEVEAGQVEELSDFSKQLAGYKSEAAVDAYIHCWESDRELRDLYLKKYRALVKAAATAADVPYSVLACLFFRESHFKKDVKSQAVPPAVGIAQMMPDTWTRVTGYLSGTPRATNPYVAINLRKGVARDGSRADQVTAKIEAIYAKHLKNGAITDRAQIEKMTSLLVEYQTLVPKNAKTAKNYLSLFLDAEDRIEMQKMFGAYQKSIGRRITSFSRNDPVAAIGLGAIYLKTLIFGGLFEKDGRYRYPSHDRWIIATGAYNSGVGNSKCSTEMTADECIRATSVEETKNHMIAIRNCSEQGNRNPMPGDKGPACFK